MPIRRIVSAIVTILCIGMVSAPAFGIDIALTVRNREASARTMQPVTSGIPFAQGVLVNVSKVRLLKGGSEIPAQFLRTAVWPDDSVRWLLVDFQVDLPASGTASLTLQTGKAPQSVQGSPFLNSPARSSSTPGRRNSLSRNRNSASPGCASKSRRRARPTGPFPPRTAGPSRRRAR